MVPLYAVVIAQNIAEIPQTPCLTSWILDVSNSFQACSAIIIMDSDLKQLVHEPYLQCTIRASNR